jgi:hypothetical protein
MFKVPKFFHDILGEETHVVSLVMIGAVSVAVMVWLIMAEGDVFVQKGIIRGAFAFLLLIDIIAGTVANFTKGTNDYYAARPINRWAFIAVHIQPILITWLLGYSLLSAILIWGYTVFSVSVVNILKGSIHQRVASGALMVLGIFTSLVLYKDASLVLMTMSVFFVIKVIYSFGVDHEGSVKHD